MRKSGAVVVLVACLAVASQAIVLSSESSHRPPQNLKKVGDHWTPWDPPPAGPDAYIIQKDDTLWDLAEEWLGDPFLWPQIWDENRYILDSHWIYPGDPLVIPGKPTVVPDGGPTAEGARQAHVRPFEEGRPARFVKRQQPAHLLVQPLVGKGISRELVPEETADHLLRVDDGVQGHAFAPPPQTAARELASSPGHCPANFS